MESPKLIQDLGVEVFKSYSKRVGIFECPICASHFKTRINSVNSGNTKSCGCNRKGNYKHGGKGTRLYSCWCGMFNRVRSNGRHFKWYKNIDVCEDWKDFLNFKTWAELSGYKDTLVLDRIDSTKNYCPDNCRWLSQSDNAKNAMLLRWGNNGNK